MNAYGQIKGKIIFDEKIEISRDFWPKLRHSPKNILETRKNI